MHEDQGVFSNEEEFEKEFEEKGEIMKDLDSDDDNIEAVIGRTYIKLTQKEKKGIKKPWRNTLIVKLLGRNIS